MINSKIIISVAIVLIIGVAAAGYQISQTPELWKLTDPQSNPDQGDQSSTSDVVSGQTSGSQSSSGDQASDGGSTVKISSSEAQKLANEYIEEPGYSAGTPVLKTIDGTKVYVVPIEKNGESVGEIYIDPNTGENLGGAGGAP